MSRRQSSRNFLQIDTPDRNSCDVYRRCGPSAAEPTPFRFTAGPGELAISGWPLGTVIDWGDGTTTTVTAATTTHTYAVGGEGSILGASAGAQVSGVALRSVDDWGTGPFAVEMNPYWGQDIAIIFSSYLDEVSWADRLSPNLTSVPSTAPPGVTLMCGMFYGASAFNGDISGWDVSSVTDMGYMLAGDPSEASIVPFNQDLSGWDVSSVTVMEAVFSDSLFNQDISAWDVSNVTTMRRMFRRSPFNQDISGWDVSNVTNMNNMFQVAAAFNQDLSSWCVSQFPTKPADFDTDATAWVLPKPVWGTCP